MGVAAQIELIGNSEARLKVRAEVLERFWVVETVALDRGDLPALGSELVVICASVPGPEQLEWVNRVRQAKPQMLIVRVNGFDSGPLAGADATVDEAHGPGALVSTIYELLTERGLASRGWPGEDGGGWVQ